MRVVIKFFCLFLGLMCLSVSAQAAEKLELRILAGNEVITGELADNPLTRQLLAASPLTLKMQDYASSEKIAYPPSKLTTSGAKGGLDPQPGDVALFAPWGNLVVFYGKGHSSEGLFFLGKITSGLEKLSQMAGDFEAVWEITQPVAKQVN